MNLPENGGDTPLPEHRLQIVLTHGPVFCLDTCALSSACDGTDGYAATGAASSLPVVVNPCDDERPSQKFGFNASTREIVATAPSDAIEEELCLGWGSGQSVEAPTIDDMLPLTLRRCAAAFHAPLVDDDDASSTDWQQQQQVFQWDERFYVEGDEPLPTHGAFYFDPFRNALTRGVVQPQNVHELTAMDDLYKSISSEPAGKSYYDYTVWNTSVMSVVVAGNSTVREKIHIFVVRKYKNFHTLLLNFSMPFDDKLMVFLFDNKLIQF